MAKRVSQDEFQLAHWWADLCLIREILFHPLLNFWTTNTIEKYFI